MSDLHIHQLESSADALLWALAQIPSGRHFLQPLPIFGERPVARVLYHQMWREREVILPYLRSWGAEIAAQSADTLDEREETDWRAAEHRTVLLQEGFRQQRDAMIAILRGMDTVSWDDMRETQFGLVTPRWLVVHVYQMTVTHTALFLRMSLYWDLYLDELQAQRLEEGRRKKNQW